MAASRVGIWNMRTPANIYAHELEAQHTIQSDDLLTICRLAKVEKVFDKIESFSFEQFFGFACHLFLTTDSQHSRMQLVPILSKFGSIAVFSLLKISHRLSSSENYIERAQIDEKAIAELAMQSLKAMPVSTLVIGLAHVIEAKEGNHCSDRELMEMVVPALVALTAHHGENILLLLSQKITPAVWNQLQQQLIQALSTLKLHSPRQNSTHRIKVKVKTPTLRLVELAC